MVDLNRQYGQTQPAAQRTASRSAAARLFGSSDPVRKGELSTLVRAPREQAAVGLLDKTQCLDCSAEVVNPLRSQPRRCRPCGQAKRREHNELQKQRVEELLAATSGQSVAVNQAPEEEKQAPATPVAGRSIWDPE